MKIRTRHRAAIVLGLATLVVALAALVVFGVIGALAAAGLVTAAWVVELWSVRRKPEYHDRNRLYFRLEQWIDSHACGELLEVDGLFVQCCPHWVGRYVRLWPQVAGHSDVCVDDYILQDLAPGIRHVMALGTTNCRKEVQIAHPTTFRAIVRTARFEHKSGVGQTTLMELHELLDRLDRATLLNAQS